MFVTSTGYKTRAVHPDSYGLFKSDATASGSGSADSYVLFKSLVQLSRIMRHAEEVGTAEGFVERRRMVEAVQHANGDDNLVHLISICFCLVF